MVGAREKVYTPKNGWKYKLANKIKYIRTKKKKKTIKLNIHYGLHTIRSQNVHKNDIFYRCFPCIVLIYIIALDYRAQGVL